MHSIQTQTLSKLTHHAAALVAFANVNEKFAAILFKHISYLSKESHKETILTPSPLLAPLHLDVAEQRLVWLMNEIKLANPNKTNEAKAILSTWAKQYESPQDLILGIVGLAIIGPTLGMIKKKKKRRSQMRIILNQSELKKGQKNVIELTLEASNGLLGNEIANVGGNAYRLDPELADWLFTEHDTTTYNSNNKELKETQSLLERDSLPHFVIKSDNTIRAIAVAPAVSDDFLNTNAS